MSRRYAFSFDKNAPESEPLSDLMSKLRVNEGPASASGSVVDDGYRHDESDFIDESCRTDKEHATVHDVEETPSKRGICDRPRDKGSPQLTEGASKRSVGRVEPAVHIPADTSLDGDGAPEMIEFQQKDP